MFYWLEATFYKQCSSVDRQISFFRAFLDLVTDCAEEILEHIKQNLAKILCLSWAKSSTSHLLPYFSFLSAAQKSSMGRREATADGLLYLGM